MSAHNRIFEWGIAAIDSMYSAIHRCDDVAFSYYSSRMETAKLSLAWMGKNKLVRDIEAYQAHAYHAFYNLRVYDYPTQ